ncbi:MAG: ankyrin repeat domain-containing protein [bacterium]
MFRKYSLFIIIILFSYLSYSCKQDVNDRTRIRTTDVEIPTSPPQQVAPPAAQAVPQDQHFREACLDGQLALVDKYISEGGDIKSADENGRTGLMLASFNGHTEIVEKLINKGAEINKIDMMGRTSLMYASTGHFPETVELLLSNGAETNLVDDAEQFTALMFAGAEGNTEVIRLLLDHGADPALTDKDGDTAESFARQNGHSEAADILNKASKK